MTVEEIIELGFAEIDAHGNTADALHYSPEIGAHIAVSHLLCVMYPTTEIKSNEVRRT